MTASGSDPRDTSAPILPRLCAAFDIARPLETPPLQASLLYFWPLLRFFPKLFLYPFLHVYVQELVRLSVYSPWIISLFLWFLVPCAHGFPSVFPNPHLGDQLPLEQCCLDVSSVSRVQHVQTAVVTCQHRPSLCCCCSPQSHHLLAVTSPSSAISPCFPLRLATVFISHACIFLRSVATTGVSSPSLLQPPSAAWLPVLSVPGTPLTELPLEDHWSAHSSL